MKKKKIESKTHCIYWINFDTLIKTHKQVNELLHAFILWNIIISTQYATRRTITRNRDTYGNVVENRPVLNFYGLPDYSGTE